MEIIDTKISIDSDVETVWNVLTDFSAYEKWNPFISRVSVDMNVGGVITFDEQRPNMPTATYKSTVQYVDKHKRFGWWGGVKYIWHVEHTFFLEKIAENKTSLSQQEKCTGVVVPFIKAKMAGTEKGFLLMNSALKARAEAMYSRLHKSGLGG